MVTRGYGLHRLIHSTQSIGASWWDHVVVGVKRVNWKLKVSLLKEEVAKLVNHPEALWAGGEEYVDDELM